MGGILDMFTQTTPAPLHPKESYAILYGEAANDPEGWKAKLNTYNKARRSNESLDDALKRKSSAYRGKSTQYTKALTGNLSPGERQVLSRIQTTMDGFSPDPNWNYTFHENPELPAYVGKAKELGISNEDAMLIRLHNQWGKYADYDKRVRIGKEFYFPPAVQRTVPQQHFLSSPRSYDEGNFNNAFSQAVKQHKPEFTWHGKRFTTRTK